MQDTPENGPAPGPDTHIMALARLTRRKPTAFTLTPDAQACTALAEQMDIVAVRKLRFTGILTPEGKRDWRLDATLGATVVQPCVVTLAPVTTRIETTLTRRYLDNMPDLASLPEDELEMPEDDTVEPLHERLDLGEVMAEALALALPDYPRADEANLGEAVFAAPGVTPMSDLDAKPLAGLAALRDKLSKDDDGAT